MRDIKTIQADIKAYKGKKSTKGYKTLKKELAAAKAPQNKSDLGLGDIVEVVTKATGIKAIVDALPFDCGCEERKAEWNKITIKNIFKRKSVINEVSEEDYATLCEIFKDGMPRVVTPKLQKDAHRVYKNTFNIGKPTTSCAPCLKSTIQELHKLYVANTKQ